LRNTGVSSDNRAGSAAKSSQSGAQGKAASAKPDDAGTVELSGAALLEELGEQIKNLPEVNEARVDAVKQALTKGEYQPDAEVIARKYSEIEKLLP
jgi:negative regulator of flagellin synthesis FlgM